ncbi:hypothetical protein GCM10023213_14330 [Prosthecobacter algae]|uniref:AAA domain-containing protein n=1 Tax=Prosthecobacter algae TaxID=1144682 RepID=A0ABP9NZA8_9BACT
MPALHHNHPEAEERTEVQPAVKTLWKAGKHWTTYPEEWQNLIIQCADIQARLRATGAQGRNWSDEDFAGTSAIGGKWASFRVGLYPYPATAKTRTELRLGLDDLLAHARNHELRTQDAAQRAQIAAVSSQFIELPDYQAIRGAISAAHAKIGERNEERLVVFRARTRGGKTWLADKLMEEGIVTWKVTATPCWKASYKAMLLKLAELIGISEAKRTVLDLETVVLKSMKTLAGVLLFEEVQSLCHQSQEFIKTILNETTLTVCIFITNEAHDTLLGKGGNELAQLFARAEANLPASPITAEIVRLFNPALYAQVAHEGQLVRIAKAANDLGALSAVRRITDMIRADVKTGAVITDQIVDAAIADYRSHVPIVRTTRALFGASTTTRKAA